MPQEAENAPICLFAYSIVKLQKSSYDCEIRICNFEIVSDQIRKGLLHLPELGNTQPKEEGNDNETEGKARPVDGAVAAQNAPAETVDDPHHRVKTVEQPPPVWNHAAAKAHR